MARLARPEERALRIEAGWHLIQGGEDLEGADMIAAATHDAGAVSTMIANLHHVGRPLEAALQVYCRYGRSLFARMPLLAALAQAGYYEDRVWGDRYGDEAVDACEGLSGVRTARQLRPYLGRWISLAVGMLFALVRFRLTPRRERDYPFGELLVLLFGTVTTITGLAALSLHVERARRIAHVLEVFAMLPERFTPVGIYQFCIGLSEIGRERQTEAYDSFNTLLARFQDPNYYRLLPRDARVLYVTGAHFARGVFATFRADGRDALVSADALEASGFKMYAMIASEIRFLHYTYRGELLKAQGHREQVELHAAHVGSAWQVETWESAALIPILARLRDVVGLTRIVDRLDEMCEKVPSLKLYKQLAYLAQMQVRGAFDAVEGPALRVLATQEPRSFIGWGHFCAFIARAFNEVGDHAKTLATLGALSGHLSDADREFVALFLDWDIEIAIASAGLGQVDEGLAMIDALLHRYQGCDHPLVHGTLHEARARIAWKSGYVADYVHSLALVERWLRPTGTPGLLARIHNLAELQRQRSGHRHNDLDSAGGVAEARAILVPESTPENDERTVVEAMKRPGTT
jgi:hypothetical protein